MLPAFPSCRKGASLRAARCAGSAGRPGMGGRKDNPRAAASRVFPVQEGGKQRSVLRGQWEAPIEAPRFLSCCLLSSWNPPCQAGLPGNAVNAVISPGIWSQLFNKALQGSHCWLNGLSKNYVALSSWRQRLPESSFGLWTGRPHGSSILLWGVTRWILCLAVCRFAALHHAAFARCIALCSPCSC